MTGLRDIQHCLNHGTRFQNIRQLDDAARVQNQHRGHLAVVQKAQRFLLPLAQVIVSRRQTAVFSLAGNPADDIDGGFRTGNILRGHRTALGQDKGIGAVGIKAVFYGFGLFQHQLLPIFPGILITGFVFLQPILADNRNPRILQSLINGNRFSVVHIAGANTAFDGLHRTAAQQCHGNLPKGQQSIIFQQHHALGGNLPGKGAMGLFTVRYGGICGTAVRKEQIGIHAIISLKQWCGRQGKPACRWEANYSFTPPRVIPAMINLESSR